jgi:cysteine desulfurase
VHTDAAQAVGRVSLDVQALDVDLVSLSAHKMGGPAGVGALWVRRGVALAPRIHGGGQERGRRAGTENLIGIAGFAAAARAARRELDGVAARLGGLRDRLWSGIQEIAGDAVRNGPCGRDRLPNTLNVTIPGVAGDSALVLFDLEGIAISIGSACAVGAAAPSHVLLAMGRDSVSARAGLRFSFGWNSTAADVDAVLAVFPRIIARIREGRAA